LAISAVGEGLPQGLSKSQGALKRGFDFLGAAGGLVLTIKALAFGFLVAFVPLYSGMHAPPGLTGVPIGVLKGMVRLFTGLLTVEMVLFGLAWL